MSEHRAHTCIHGKQRRQIRMRSSKNQMYRDHCKYTFQRIAKKCDQTGLPPQYSQSIGCSRISASLTPDINMMQFS